MRLPALLAVRMLSALLLAATPGCSAVGPLLGAEAASTIVFGKGVVDLGVSAVSGRDCSLARLDRGLTYCAARTVAFTEPYCTRTLGTVDCWSAAPRPGDRAGVGDTPDASDAKTRFQAARWPKTITAPP